MAIRQEVQRFLDLGPFPASRDMDANDIDRRDELLRQIRSPVSREEGTALLQCFGPDDAYGVAWSLLHLIETAPGGPLIGEQPDETANEWVRLIWESSQRKG